MSQAGLEVAGIAASAPAALSLAAVHKPDLALVDIRLAGDTDGIELAIDLDQKHSVPAIFVSGALYGDTLRRARAARPRGFLHKPFLPSEAFNAIERALMAA